MMSYLEQLGVGVRVIYTLGTIQVDLIQMDDYPADSCAMSPTAFLLTVQIRLHSFFVSKFPSPDFK